MLDKNVGDYSIAKVKTWVLSIIQVGFSGRLRKIFVLSYGIFFVILMSCRHIGLVISKCKENLLENNPNYMRTVIQKKMSCGS